MPFTVSVLVDGYGRLLSICVLFIARQVFSFAQGYIKDEVHVQRFAWVLLAFVISINLLVYSRRLLGLFLGWDGLGLTSFVLVMYYQNAYAAGARLVTLLTNRVGDVALLIVVVLRGVGHWQIRRLELRGVVAVLLVFGAITKRAQFPFSGWLPQAIAAPTPVSALVHSSTLVTAGVYLLIRFFPLLEGRMVSYRCLFLGSVTMLLAGVSACVEYDLKKVVAYSTLRQLGVMFVALGLNRPILAFFHLLTHAIFKALLFLCVGVCIHFHRHMQDIRAMGNLSQRLPVTQRMILVANLALCGTPFLAGFYSKEPILELTLANRVGWVRLFFILGATRLTTTYTVRRFGMTQWGVSLAGPLRRCHETPVFFRPILFLGAGAVIGGAVLNWVLVPAFVPISTTLLMRLAPLALIARGAGFRVMRWAQYALEPWGRRGIEANYHL